MECRKRGRLGLDPVVNTFLPVPWYTAINNILKKGTGQTHNLESLNHIYCYMGDVITMVQDGPERK